MPGPAPKRSDQRRRRNIPAVPVTKAAAAPTHPLEPDETWHPIARDWFLALGRSGQSAFYQDSDWATARWVAEAMHRNLSAGRFSAQLFAAIMSASSSLLVTEGDRRRVRLELERVVTDVDEAAAAAALDEYRARFAG